MRPRRGAALAAVLSATVAVVTGAAGPVRQTPVQYCLTYGAQPEAADTIRLASAIGWTSGAGGGVATAEPFALDSMHTPRLHARDGRWHRLKAGIVQLEFGGAAWRYVYLMPAGGGAGRVHVESDMHLEQPRSWRFTARSCGNHS